MYIYGTTYNGITIHLFRTTVPVMLYWYRAVVIWYYNPAGSTTVVLRVVPHEFSAMATGSTVLQSTVVLKHLYVQRTTTKWRKKRTISMPVANADNPPIGTWGSQLHMIKVYVPHPTKPPLVLPLGESSVLGGRRRVVLYVLLLRPFCDLNNVMNLGF